MISIYNRTDYVMLPNIQAAQALKRQIRTGKFSNWAVGRAEAYRLVAEHYNGAQSEAAHWRRLMRDNARNAVRDAKYVLGLISYTGGAR
tara:strand:+ start:834 stop:1100 length:267 start_codon:yes stop_codon:yes gene_type:complete